MTIKSRKKATLENLSDVILLIEKLYL